MISPGDEIAGDPDRAKQIVARRRRSSADESGWRHWRLAATSAGCWAFLILAFALDRLTDFPEAGIAGLYAVSYLFGGSIAVYETIKGLRHRQVGIDLLMVTAAIGAASIGAWAEGAVLLGLFSASNALEYHALGRTRSAVRALMDLSPQEATVLRPGTGVGEATVPLEALTLQDVLLVRPGERFATDGIVETGETSADQSAITGESMPVMKRRGDQVFAGTINGQGAVQVQIIRLPHESTLANIIDLVESAQAAKSRAQRVADAFEGRYAIGVITFAALVALVPILFGHDPGPAIYRAMTVLVVASPCALVISTPASTLSALANAARRGILFKGSNHLEDTGGISIVAFDKTGTLTEGQPRVTDIVSFGMWSDEEVLRRAASVERLSEHPLAEAIVREAHERRVAVDSATDFKAVVGKGVRATVDGEELAIGNEPIFADFGVATPSEVTATASRLRGAGKTVVLIGDRAGVRGLIAIADVVRPQALEVIQELKRIGISRTVMLTGDNRLVGEAIAAPLGIDEVRADLLPEEKLTAIRSLMEEGKVAMVGDGVNDAPALATATVGIAMGAAGSDVALETADVVLMADRLEAIPYAIQLSRRTRRIIRQNLAFSIGVIVVLVSLALTVGIPLPVGVIGHEGSTILVVLNGMRLLRPLTAPNERHHLWTDGAARLRAVLQGRPHDAPPVTTAGG